MNHLSKTLDVDVKSHKELIAKTIDDYLQQFPPEEDDNDGLELPRHPWTRTDVAGISRESGDEDVLQDQKRAAGPMAGQPAKRARVTSSQAQVACGDPDVAMSVELNGKGTKWARVRQYRCAWIEAAFLRALNYMFLLPKGTGFAATALTARGTTGPPLQGRHVHRRAGVLSGRRGGALPRSRQGRAGRPSDERARGPRLPRRRTASSCLAPRA
jgi:hypothetical protein